jgi:hypothetical protein
MAADEILASQDSEFYIVLEPTREDKERLDKFMIELLSDEPLFDEKKVATAEDLGMKEKKQFWRNDRYKLYQPIYESTWNDQDFVGNLE